MKYLALLSVFFLSGCWYQSINNNDIQTAIKACDSLEKIVEIHASWDGTETVFCTSRQKYYLDKNILNP